MDDEALTLEDLVISGNHPFFDSPEFQNTAELRDYLLGKHGDGEAKHEPVFDYVNRLVDTISRLRFEAEQLNHEQPGRAIDKAGALPLSSEKIKEILEESKGDKEPPVTAITRIAQGDMGILEQLLPSMRKLLRRNRELVPIAKVQQLDVRSMIWLTQQPGKTPLEKAGSRQRILAVVREENLNTLENRVFKALLQHCVFECACYIRLYDTSEAFHNSQRMLAVRRMQRFAKHALDSGELSAVGKLVGMPQPNYVLLHDTRYMRIWQMYRDLMHKTRLWEEVWKWRHRVFRDYMLLLLAVAVDTKFKDRKNLFHSDFWFLLRLKDGHFLEAPLFSRVIDFNGNLMEISLGDRGWRQENGKADIYVRFQGEEIKRVQLYYMPECLKAQPEGTLRRVGTGWLHDEFELGPEVWLEKGLTYVKPTREWITAQDFAYELALEVSE